jgi:hypothetical protein
VKTDEQITAEAVAYAAGVSIGLAEAVGHDAITMRTLGERLVGLRHIIAMAYRRGHESGAKSMRAEDETLAEAHEQEMIDRANDFDDGGVQ